MDYVEEFGNARVPLRFKYKDFNLGAWVSNQKINNKNDKLNLERIKLLESLLQWSWDILEDQWNEGFECLKKYIEKHGKTKVPNRFKYEYFNLGRWVGVQRICKKSNKLDVKRIKLLESLPDWSWDTLEDQWNEGFNNLKKYIEEHGNSKITAQLKYNDYLLGSWVSEQRKKGKNKLPIDRIKKLESLPQWSWNVFEDQWNDGFEYLKKYIEEHGDAIVPQICKYDGFNLGSWVATQKANKNNKKKLDVEKAKKLESLPQWSWNVFENQWNEGFEYLKKYIEECGHAKVPYGFKYQNFNLGSWVSDQRKNKGKIDLKRIQQLESLPQWSWNLREDNWNECFFCLKKYTEKYGTSKISTKFKYEGCSLGRWVISQREAKTKNKINSARIILLESLPDWSWDTKSDTE